MKSTNTVIQAIKRFGRMLADLAIAMDASPSELVYAEISALRREIAELEARTEPIAQHRRNGGSG